MEHQLGGALQACIDECLRCYTICKREAMNHCLETGGKHVEPDHFRLMITCAEICRTSADFMLSGSDLHGHVCAACAEVCAACATSCKRLGGMEECGEACARCATSCFRMSGQ